VASKEKGPGSRPRIVGSIFEAQLMVDAGPAVMRARSFSRTGAKN